MTKTRNETRMARFERLAMERLQDLLDPKETPRLWPPDKAAWYLIGIDIDQTCWSQDLDRARHGYKWLPNGESSYAQDPDARDQGVDDRFQYVAAFCGGDSRRPVEWIRHAISKGFEPVWLRMACADPRCRKHLTRDILKRFVGLAPGEKPQSRGGKAKSAGDEKSEAMRELRPLFEAWWLSCPKVPSTGIPARGERAKFAADMAYELEELVTTKAIENRVRGWIAEKLRAKPIVHQTHPASAGF